MKRSGYKTVIGLLIVQALFILPNTVLGADVEKKFNKEFSTQGIELLKINNRYGDVKVENWNDSRVVIDVVVTLEHPNKDKAEKLLSLIEIVFIENDNTIEARTDINSKFSIKGFGDNKRFSIDYVVKMPTDLNLNLSNRYGSVRINELSGLVNIKVKYGSLYVDKLTRGKEKPLNSIILEYAKGEIVESGWTELTLRYVGKMLLGNARALLLDSRYSTTQIEKAGSVVSDSKYDNLKVECMKNLVAEADYTKFDVDTLTGKLNIEANYGSVTIQEIKRGFDFIDIVSRYCSVKLDIEDDASYQLNVITRYGGISFDEERADIINRIYDNNSKSIEAVIGDKESNSTVKIKTSYGSVKVY
ncbi:MAG: hypothetical protein K8R35_03650 [Bacteroidales bacterium]|nr:hypothetical protein [Bacteroidales bacterium]